MTAPMTVAKVREAWDALTEVGSAALDAVPAEGRDAVQADIDTIRGVLTFARDAAEASAALNGAQLTIRTPEQDEL
ncbi:hypothetical protein ACWGJ9_11715 [Curtobacterium citreum]